MTSLGHLDIRGVAKRFSVSGAALQALEGVDLDVAPGEFVTIVGASGCGKSTLLRMIAGLESVTAGEIRDAMTTVPTSETSIPATDTQEVLSPRKRYARTATKTGDADTRTTLAATLV